MSTTKNDRSNAWRPTKSFRSPAAYYPCSSPKFKPAREECQWRMGSYRNIYSQFSGTASKTAFSPTTANKWIRYINSGARVYKYSNTDFRKYFGTIAANFSPTMARQHLRKKFGPAIKDVTRGNSNCWLVATTKNVTGRPFINYHWK